MSDTEFLWHRASRILLQHTDDALEVPVQDSADRQRFALVDGTWRHYPDGYPVLNQDVLFHIEAAAVRLMWSEGLAT